MSSVCWNLIEIVRREADFPFLIFIILYYIFYFMIQSCDVFLVWSTSIKPGSVESSINMTTDITLTVGSRGSVDALSSEQWAVELSVVFQLWSLNYGRDGLPHYHPAQWDGRDSDHFYLTRFLRFPSVPALQYTVYCRRSELFRNYWFHSSISHSNSLTARHSAEVWDIIISINFKLKLYVRLAPSTWSSYQLRI